MPRITDLSAATLPVDGSEIAVFVQSGVTVQAALSDIVPTLSGGVASVAMTVPTGFSVSGSPVTSNGTLAISKDAQDTGKVWAGPVSGSAAAPTFRRLTAADITIQNGLVTHTDNESITAPGTVPLWQMLYVPALDKLFALTNNASGKLFYMDRTTDTLVLIATFTGKTPSWMIYSSVNGHLYIAYGNQTMEVDPSNGTIINSGIAFNMAYGAAIRPSTGKIYSPSNGGVQNEVKSLDPATNTVSATLSTPDFLGPSLGYDIAYCSTNDSMYIGVVGNGTKIARHNCATNVATTFTAYSTGSQICPVVYAANEDRIYTGSGATNNLYEVNPASDAVAVTHPFPAGYTEPTGTRAMIEFGDYLYINTNRATPYNGMILIFHKPSSAFVGALLGGVAGFGSMLGGVVAENVLYAGNFYSGSLGAGDYSVHGRYR